jgi:GDP-mannose transporter
MADGKPREEFTIEMDDLDREQREGLLAREASERPTLAIPHEKPSNEALISIISYCVSSIVMTTSNKYVLSGADYNLNFLLLAVQVCVLAAELGSETDRCRLVHCLRYHHRVAQGRKGYQL